MGIVVDGDDEEMMMVIVLVMSMSMSMSMVLLMLFLLDRLMAMAHGQLWLLSIIMKLVMPVLLDFVLLLLSAT